MFKTLCSHCLKEEKHEEIGLKTFPSNLNVFLYWQTWWTTAHQCIWLAYGSTLLLYVSTPHSQKSTGCHFWEIVVYMACCLIAFAESKQENNTNLSSNWAALQWTEKESRTHEFHQWVSNCMLPATILIPRETMPREPTESCLWCVNSLSQQSKLCLLLSCHRSHCALTKIRAKRTQMQAYFSVKALQEESTGNELCLAFLILHCELMPNQPSW